MGAVEALARFIVRLPRAMVFLSGSVFLVTGVLGFILREDKPAFLTRRKRASRRAGQSSPAASSLPCAA